MLRNVMACTTLICLSSMNVLAQSLEPQVIWAMPKSARIKCVTQQPGRMTVEYGTTPALGNTSTPEMRDWPDRDVTRHYVNITGLQPNTQYYYRVRVDLQDGGQLVSDVRTFRTFRAFSHILPTVRYSSYIIGSDWSSNDTNAPYHEWNAEHYDLNIAYAFENAAEVKRYNPDAVMIRYDNITNSYAGAWREQNMHWMRWAEQQGISYEHVALHYAVDTEVQTSTPINDRGYLSAWVLTYKVERFDHAGKRFPDGIGKWVAFGLALRFDILYLDFSSYASGGYDGVWEYCNGIDAQGNPISWAPLTIVEDTTMENGQRFARNGYIRFVPPKERTEWVRAYIGYTSPPPPLERWFYIRFRVTQTGTSSPVVTSFQNEDFVKTGSASDRQIIPGWDSSWEDNPNNNGDPEYNPNPPSAGGPGVAKSARFKWWSRVWYYRPDLQRFMTNVFDPYYQQWLTQAWFDYIFQTYPALDGWYCDNYTLETKPLTPVSPSTSRLVELDPYDTYAYALGMGELMEKCSISLTERGKISVANNFVGLSPADDWSNPRINAQPDRLWMYFAPAIANREITMQLAQYYGGHARYSTLNTLFAEMAYRVSRGNYHVPMYAYTQAVKSDKNTQDWWYREKMFALAAYLLVKDVEDEYLYLNAWHQNFFYGEFLTDPSSSLNRYYIPGIPKQKAYYIDAATYDFGRPVTTVGASYTQWVAYPNSWMPGIIPGLFVIYYTDQAPAYDSNGNFLGNTSKTWYFARRYTNALVVLRTGDSRNVLDERSMNEHTAFDLGGNYRRLQADGSLDPTPINRLNLRVQEAAILIPTDQPPPANPDVRITVSSDKTNPRPLDVVTVTITALNSGSSDAINVRIRHDIPASATYVLGSLRINGVVQPDPSDRTKIDVTIPSIPAGGQATVVFQMVIR
ncbi:MAG: fibronectin type III domain-containing protein [Chthonomonadetes bacterium]|nr:fibronectin type III domain-containing protein [Chthonomonadetes bacterium]